MQSSLTDAVPGRRWTVLTPDAYTESAMTVKYKVALHRSEEGFSASVPGLPGCWSQGETEEEALENIRDAIRAYLAVVDEQLAGAAVREVEVAV